jgi:serine/threonine protein phosphatase 1
MGRRIVVGDIHGCYDELEALLERVQFTTDDRLVAVGDL